MKITVADPISIDGTRVNPGTYDIASLKITEAHAKNLVAQNVGVSVADASAQITPRATSPDKLPNAVNS
jgi:hypothetical protein